MNKDFKILKIDHIAFATDSISESINFFTDVLGVKACDPESILNEGVNVLKVFNEDNKTAFEIIEPLNENSTINKFLKNKGKGLHHLALEVDNILNAIKYLDYKSVQLIYQSPQIGSDNKLITFVHPKHTPGLLLELCQKQ